MEANKRDEVAENIAGGTGIPRARVDELRLVWNDACDDRDRSFWRGRSVGEELEAAGEEESAHSLQHIDKLQQLAAKAAGDIIQVAPAKKQLEAGKLAGIELECEKLAQSEAVSYYAHSIGLWESEHAKMEVAMDECSYGEQKSTTLIEELQMKYEVAKMEKKAIIEQLWNLRDELLHRDEPLGGDYVDTAAVTGMDRSAQGGRLGEGDVEIDNLDATMDEMNANVFEADVCHFKLISPTVVEVHQNDAEGRIKELQLEKELLARMFEKLSCKEEEQQLVYGRY